MATTKSGNPKTGSAKTEDTAGVLKARYKEYVLTHGHEPVSIFLFTRELGLEEEQFYSYYGSFEGIDSVIWLEFMDQTIETVKKDKTYGSYSSRERLLAFYYTLMERLKKDRSYVKYIVNTKIKRPEFPPAFLGKFRDRFISYVEELVREGVHQNEIVQRPIITNRYKDGLWIQLLFVIRFWLKDDSVNFEKTDAAIEKSVNLAFDFFASGPLEKIIDFAKFLYQNRF